MSKSGLQAANVPAELRDLRQWVAWRIEKRKGKATKVPYDPRTGRRAKADDPKTWTSFTEVGRAFDAGKYSGIGFEFSADDPYAGIDLDGAVDGEGEIKPWAQALLECLPETTYVELSPSGKGLHIILRGRKPGDRCKTGYEDGAVEIYDQRRFFTVTGHLLNCAGREVTDSQEALDAIYARVFDQKAETRGTPAQEARTPLAISDQELLEKAFASKAGADIEALWRGDVGSYPSRSEADLALCSHLWFWTGGDATRVDLLFRRSGLMRNKWDREDYRRRTIDRAAGSKVYEPRSLRVGHETASANRNVTSPGPSVYLNPKDKPQRDNTHRANAWRITQKYGDRLRFVPGLGFIVYDSRRWSPSKHLALKVAARVSGIICAEIAMLGKQASTAKEKDRRRALEERMERLANWARASEQGSAIRESLKLCGPLLLLDPKKLDSDPLLLNVENGTINLESGELRRHDPEDLITKVAPVRYSSGAVAPGWRAFIQKIMGERATLVRYLQKALGYSITGLVREQCLFFAFGEGQNGKSTLLDAIHDVLGSDYVTKTAPDLLMVSKDHRPHPSEIADLRSVRIAISQEVAGVKIFDSQKLKELTGERWLKARRMYGEWFEFSTTFKIWLAANHRPQVDDATTAFWRRIRLIPFTEKIMTPDRDLPFKLSAERSGILNWLIEGARMYLKEGLDDTPAEVVEAVAEYRESSDSLGQFVSECCVTSEGMMVKATELWTAYEAFTVERGLRRIRKRDLKMELLNRGFQQPPRRGDGFYYQGLALKSRMENESGGDLQPQSGVN